MTLIERINLLSTRIGTEIKSIPVKLSGTIVTAGNASTTQMNLKGDVCIGTTTPSGWNAVTLGGAGTVSIGRSVNNGNLDIYGGTNYLTGAYFKVTGNALNLSPGNSCAEFTIGAQAGSYPSSFNIFSFDGNYTWTSRLKILGVNGNVGIGIENPTASLNIKAGAAAVGQAPLKFTTGVLLTAPENGTIEYDGADFYFTKSSTRYKIPVKATGAELDTGTDDENLATAKALKDSNYIPIHVGTTPPTDTSMLWLDTN